MSRVLVIGVDGGTWDLLDALVAAGHMPTLGALLRQAVRGTLESTEPPVTPVAWTTFQTGVGPERHGVYGFYNLRVHGGVARFVSTSSRTIRVKTLWEYAGSLDRTVAVLACPMTYPPFPVNGILLSGFPAPSSSRAATYPPSLTDDVARLGVSAVVPAGRLDVLPSTDPSSEEAVAAALLKAAAFVEERVRLAVHLLRTYPWDLGFFQFQETDWVQHAFWPELASGMRTGSFPSGLTAFYRAVDNGLGALLDLLDASDHVFVISDHGFQECRKEVLLNAWLVRHGYLRIRRGPAQWVFGLVSRIRRVVDPGRRLVGRIPRERRARLASRVNLGRLDWSRSVAYVFSDGSSPTGGLYLLGAPDQAAGVLESLRALRDPETGGPVVESVLPLAEDRVDGGPRLWVGLADGYAVGSGFYSGQVFRARVRGRDTQLGIHHRHGILVVAGPGVSRGRVLEVRPRLQDVAPTVLYSLDLLVPTYMSGSVIGAIFEDGFRHAHPVRTRQEPGGRHDTTGEGLSEAEEAAIAARLKDLGYLE